MNKKTLTALEELLKEADRSALERVIVSMCKENPDVCRNVIANLSEKNSSDFAAFRQTVEAEIRRQTNGDGYLHYGSEVYLRSVFADVLAAAEKKSEMRDSLLTLDIALFIIGRIYDIWEYSEDESDELEEAVDEALRTIRKVMAQADPGQYDAISERVLDAVRTRLRGADWAMSVLQSAVGAATENTRQAYMDAIDAISGSQRYTDAHIARSLLLRQLDGADAARQYMLDNLHVDAFREEMVDEALETEDFAEAERLCLDALAEDISPASGHHKFWQEKLHNVYAAAKDADKLTVLALEMTRLGDLKYYDEAKELLQAAGRWDDVYLSLITELSNQVSAEQYMQLLRKENELDLLMDQIRRSPADVFSYGDILFADYSEDVVDLARAAVRRASAAASSRNQYRAVGERLERLSEFGAQAEALDLLEELLRQYPRKRALREELQASKKRIGNGK